MMKCQRLMVPLLFMVNLASALLPAQPDSFSSYLFAYFTGNSIAQEAIFFAISDDAHTFKQLNKGNPILSSAKISLEGGVRDPHLLRGENNDYYMVATDMVSAKGWASNHGIVMLKSTNLSDWQSSTVDIRTAFSQYANVDRVWAPQTIYDPVAKKYMVYFAMRINSTDTDKIYYAYADSAFKKLETAPQVLYKYGSVAAIDADIISKDSLYYLFFKTEGSTQKGIKSATSKTLTGTYTLNDKYLQLTTEAVEGSCVFKLNNSNAYILMYDVYNAGRYEFATSTDLRTFTKDPKPISFDFKPRHGTVIQITANEKQALLAKWNPTGVINSKVNGSLIRSHSIIGNTLQIVFGDEPVSGSVCLFDLAGKLVVYRVAYDKSLHIQLKTLPAGVYHLQCTSGSGGRWNSTITVQ